MRIEPIEPRRVRFPRGAYGWVDLKIVTGGYLERLGPETSLTYLFLCAVGNVQGISFWSRQRMAKSMGLSSEAVAAALGRLQDEDLIAFNGRVVQVLPLAAATPATPPASDAPLSPSPAPSPVAVCCPSVQAPPPAESVVDEGSIRACEPEALRALAGILGDRTFNPVVVRALAKSIALRGRRGTAPRSDERSDRRG